MAKRRVHRALGIACGLLAGACNVVSGLTGLDPTGPGGGAASGGAGGVATGGGGTGAVGGMGGSGGTYIGGAGGTVFEGLRVFVTRDTFFGTMDVSGMLGAGGEGIGRADEHCTDAASNAGLGGGGWRAYLKDGGIGGGPSDRIEGDGPWFDLSTPNKLIFQNHVTIWTTGPVNPLVVDEHGDAITDMSYVWTGDRGSVMSEAHCDSWTYNFGAGWIGQVGGDGSAWTHGPTSIICESEAHLYCFEQP